MSETLEKLKSILINRKLYLKDAALWVKNYSHPLRVIGGVFFGLALVAGIFWISGYDVEPIAFVFSLLSSLFFSSPSIAEYILPERKPVRDMSFDELIEFITTTDPKNDWYGISRQWSSEKFLKEDPRLRFRARFDEEGIQNKDFKEEWANRHPDSHATGYWYELYYDGAFIDRIVLVAIDGARAMLPPPDFKTGKIELYNYRVAQIHDTLGTLDEYIRRSGLEIAHS